MSISFLVVVTFERRVRSSERARASLYRRTGEQTDTAGPEYERSERRPTQHASLISTETRAFPRLNNTLYCAAREYRDR